MSTSSRRKNSCRGNAHSRPMASLVCARPAFNNIAGLVVREFLSATLQQMPYAAIDGLRFERKKVGDAQLEAQVRITLFFRPSNTNETR